jgi:hypothetical protein
MDADQTYNSIVFAKSYDQVDLSLRQSTARGINIPDSLTIKSQDYVDSKTKVSGRRHTTIIGSSEVDVNGVVVTPSVSFTMNIPSTATSTRITALLATFRAYIADADTLEDTLNNEK